MSSAHSVVPFSVNCKHLFSYPRYITLLESLPRYCFPCHSSVKKVIRALLLAHHWRTSCYRRTFWPAVILFISTSSPVSLVSRLEFLMELSRKSSNTTSIRSLSIAARSIELYNMRPVSMKCFGSHTYKMFVHSSSRAFI